MGFARGFLLALLYLRGGSICTVLYFGWWWVWWFGLILSGFSFGGWWYGSGDLVWLGFILFGVGGWDFGGGSLPYLVSGWLSWWFAS